MKYFLLHKSSIGIFAILFFSQVLSAANVTFKVDMSQETVATAGVFIAGDFQQEAGFAQDWNPATTQLRDDDADGIYEVTLSIPAGYWEFKYINGNTWAGAENASGTCTKGATNNRFLTVGSNAIALEKVVFNKCPNDPNSDKPIDYPDTTGKLFWWNNAVFYEIFVRSFADSDGDGIGDFQGIINKINYLNDQNPNTQTDLGIEGIWLMPMMESTSYHGYDVEDYYAVERDYGSMQDFQRLLDTCHAHGIKVIIDLVINHTSVNHPWFKKSAANDATYRNWYRWNANPPTNLGPWGQTLWHRNNQRNSNYYGIFWSGMPDLNFEEPAVFEEIKKITQFWLDLGVDGFRLDAIKYLDEDGTTVENTPETFQHLKALRNHVEAINSEAFMVGEVWDATPKILPYVADTTLNSCFDFDLANAFREAIFQQKSTALNAHVVYMQQAYPRSAFATFLSNHDQDRIFSVLNQTDRAKLAASMYLSMPGIPFIYFGEEIGITGTGDHLNIRTPMQWEGTLKGGFTSGTPWRGFAQTPASNNVKAQQEDGQSLWNHYRNWVDVRRKYPALQTGIYWPVSLGNDALWSFQRTHARGQESQLLWAVHNLSTVERTITDSSSTTQLREGKWYVFDAFDESFVGEIQVSASGRVSQWNGNFSLSPLASTLWLLSPNRELSRDPINRQSVRVFPNPSAGTIFLSGEASLRRITLFDVLGRQAFAKDCHGAIDAKIDLEFLSEGWYLMQIETDAGLVVEKVLLK